MEKIVKGLADVAVLVPPGASPHSYEPRPSQMTLLSKSKLFFSIGGDFEDAWLPRIQKSFSKLKIIRTDDNISKAALSDDHSSSEDHHDHDGLDPHIWLSPELVIQQVTTITNALWASDPVNREKYLSNSLLFKKEIRVLQQKIHTLLVNCAKRAISGLSSIMGLLCKRVQFETDRH